MSESGSEKAPGQPQGRHNRLTLKKLAVVALVMFGFGYAMVPFYNTICAALGMNNIDQPDKVAANTQVDTSRRVTVELDSNIKGLPWEFKPLVRHVSVHPGELVQVEYQITNTQSRAITGQAIPSFAPTNAAQYFRKLECFCFSSQLLKAGESRKMPVVFVIDPAVPREVDSITMSYTFFEVPGTSSKGGGA
ncbi:MAG: hypothetical protein RIR70_128 [Pseudomonadota bacterium]|jgi:cytochrome c oxidase assembly protein subunit 11